MSTHRHRVGIAAGRRRGLVVVVHLAILAARPPSKTARARRPRGCRGGPIRPRTTRLGAALAPLGEVKRVGGDKRTDLTAEKVRDQLERDLRDGQYFVTGNLTREIFADDCRFTDPTNDVVGLSRYLTALGLLFDPATSSVDLYDIKVTSPNTVEADWQLQGYLRFPWKPRVDPYSGHTVYSLDPETKLVRSQFQTWNISGAKAIAESFTPTTGPGT